MNKNRRKKLNLYECEVKVCLYNGYNEYKTKYFNISV